MQQKNEFILHFAYGSNMLRCRLEERVGTVIDHGIGTLEKYKIKFNKESKDGSGKTNIVEDSDLNVLGVIYELTDEQIKLLDKIEVGYKRSTIKVILGDNIIPAVTYFAISKEINDNLFPTKDYLSFLILGAKEHGFPENYVKFLEKTEIKNTTKPGFVNRNGQVVIRNTEKPGTDHRNYVYQLGRSKCGYVYGVNGSDIHERKCPKCGGGEPGLDYE